ncbi:hypothetical protein Bca4012_026049 [Brassica carinata]
MIQSCFQTPNKHDDKAELFSNTADGSTPADTSQPQNPYPGTTRVTTQSQTGARVWTRTEQNLPGDDSTTRTHPTRPISPTPLSQTREQVAEMASLMAELAEHRDSTQTQPGNRSDPSFQTPTSRTNEAFRTPEFPCSQSARYPGETSQHPSRPIPAARGLNYDGSSEIPAESQRTPDTPSSTHDTPNLRPGEARSQIPLRNPGPPRGRFTPNNGNGTNQPPRSGSNEEPRPDRSYTFQDCTGTEYQREIPMIPNEAGDLQEYIERNNAELKRIHAIMHTATSAAPDIDQVIKETRRTPFTNRITSVRLHDIGKIKFPEYSGNSDPKAHISAFRLSISRAHLSDKEKEAGYCRFFAENLTGPALEWFAGLEGNSIDNFTQLVSTFLKQYSVYIETRKTVADLWNLKQAPFEPLRTYINKFREIKSKIPNLNEVVAIAALKNGVWFSSKFREEMAVRAPASLDDALHRASYFATHEEEVAALKEQFLASKNGVTKKASTTKDPPPKGQHSYAINNSPN